MAMRPDLMTSSEIPGSGAVLSSFSKIMKESGLDIQEEIEQGLRKNLEKFLSTARAGQPQGGYGKRYPATALGFKQFLADDAAYRLDQGPLGASRKEQIASAFAR